MDRALEALAQGGEEVLGADGGGCVPHADGQGPALCSLHSVIRLTEAPCPDTPLGLQHPKALLYGGLRALPASAPHCSQLPVALIITGAQRAPYYK